MFEDKMILPDARMEKLLELVGRCDTCADVGSDHGKLGACLLQRGLCRRVILTDISDASLAKARGLIRLHAMEDRTVFSVGDGLKALNEDADVIVIAGMGGETISAIMEGMNDRQRKSRYLLQANVAIPQLRVTLNRLGMMITDECLVRDGRRIYVILEAREGVQNLTEAEIEIGPVLIRGNDPLMDEYRAFRLRVARKALDGARSGSDEASVAELERQIRIWEGML